MSESSDFCELNSFGQSSTDSEGFNGEVNALETSEDVRMESLPNPPNRRSIAQRAQPENQREWMSMEVCGRYWGRGRTWETSRVFATKSELVNDLIAREMTVYKSKCRYEEANRIERNARQAYADYYFDEDDLEATLMYAREMRRRGRPSDYERVEFLKEWREREDDPEGIPDVAPCGHLNRRGRPHVCLGARPLPAA